MQTVYSKLNTQKISGLLADQQLKRWWVAESIGVHRTTLRRWLSGGIEKVRTDHVQSLANLLSVPTEEIIHYDA